MSEHPMDDFPVRPLRFNVANLRDDELVWSRSCPEFSMFINALGVHVPHFERFLVAVMRRYRGELDDPNLLADVKAIIGQEAHHAFNFVKWTERMAQSYPGLAEIDANAKQAFTKALEETNQRYQIGLTAGYETFTFLGGMIILDRYEELMGEAQEDLRALWVWHQVEEVEHGAVAFDFYKAFYADDEWYRKWMVLYAFGHIFKETFLAYRPMVAVECRGWRAKLEAWRFFASFGWDLFAASLPVLRRRYHPRNHPICNEAQSQVALRWRDYMQQGGDGLKLSDQTMAALLK